MFRIIFNLENKFIITTYIICITLFSILIASTYTFLSFSKAEITREREHVTENYRSFINRTKNSLKISNELISKNESFLNAILLNDSELVLNTLERHISSSLLDISIFYKLDATVYANGGDPGVFGSTNEFSNYISSSFTNFPVLTVVHSKQGLKLIYFTKVESLNGPVGYLLTGVNIDIKFLESIISLPGHYPYLTHNNFTLRPNKLVEMEKSEFLSSSFLVENIGDSDFLIKSKSTSPWSSEGGVLFIIGLILFLIFSYVFIRNRSEVNKTLNHLTFLSNEFEDIAAGNYLRNFDALREKNLGTIVNSFEKMCISLREKIDDISDSNSKLQELVEEGRKDVTKTLTEKEKLLRVIIHDLSNSLSIVQGNCRVLTRRYPNSDKRYTSSLAAIKKASEGMIEIVHNVRKYSSISDGKVSLDIQILSVRDILKDLLFYFKDKTNQKNIKIKFSPHLDDVNYSILAERSIVIHQVFSNILTNSIKFSAPSSVIEIIVSEESKFIKFEVKDTGVGIPEEKLSDLFKIAEATTTLGTLGEKGTGYGMSLMKAFTEKLDGEIYITSRHINKYSLDHGTSVIIKIPKAEAAQAIA